MSIKLIWLFQQGSDGIRIRIRRAFTRMSENLGDRDQLIDLVNRQAG